MASADRQNFFGFGGNMMAERMNLGTKDAVFVSAGFVKRFKLAFTECLKPEHEHDNRWNGADCSLLSTNDDNDVVWGVVYSLPLSSVALLDSLESQYARIDVQVTFADNKTVVPCFSYVHHSLLGDSHLSPPPSAALPSLEYLSVIVYGARQHNLPEWYIKYLEELPAKPKSADNQCALFDELVALSNNKLQLLAR